MLQYSPESFASVSNDLGLVITNVRSLATMNEERGSKDDRNGARQRRRDAISKARKRLQANANASQSRDASRVLGRPAGRFEKSRPGIVTRQDMADFSQVRTSSSSSKSPRSSTPGNASSRSAASKKRSKKNPNSPLQTLEQIPSTSFADQPNVFVNDVEDALPLVMFDIDCAPYNEEHHGVNETDDSKGLPSASYADGSRMHGSGQQSGRSRRTVSPYPYKLKLNIKRRNLDEWVVDDSAGPESWDHTNTLKAGSTPAFNEPAHQSDDAPQCSWQDDDPDVEGQISGLHLSDHYTVVEDGASENLKPCLKNGANVDQRASMNVSWEDHQNELETAVACSDEGENKPIRNDGEAILNDMMRSAESDPSLDSMLDTPRTSTKTPANSIEERSGLVVDIGKEDDDEGDESPPLTSSQQVALQNDGKDPPEDSVNKDQPADSASSFTKRAMNDDAISLLTDEEKHMMGEHENRSATARYDDPYLSRADRIRLLWEDCARKESILQRLRPKAGGGAGGLVSTRYSQYRY